MTVAHVLQGYVANFALKGDPNGPGLPTFPTWTAPLQADAAPLSAAASVGSRVVNLTTTGFPIVQEAAAARCGWWFETSFVGAN